MLLASGEALTHGIAPSPDTGINFADIKRMYTDNRRGNCLARVTLSSACITPLLWRARR